MQPADCPPEDQHPERARGRRERPRNRYAILHWAGHITVAGVGAAELIVIPLGPRFFWTAGLLAAFAVALALVFASERFSGKSALVILALLASGLAVAIMLVGVSPVLGAI